MWGSRREQKAGGVSLPLCAFSFCHMHRSHCLHWPLCQWQIVMSVCITPGSALSHSAWVCMRERERQERQRVLWGSACTCQERTERKWKRHTKREWNQQERKFEAKKKKKREIGRMRTFLRSLVREFQGSYTVVSQQQASSAAYNTHEALCTTTGWPLYYTTVKTVHLVYPKWISADNFVTCGNHSFRIICIMTDFELLVMKNNIMNERFI